MTLLQYVCLQLLGVPRYGKATKYEFKWRCPFCGRLTLRCLPHKPPHKDKWKCNGCVRMDGTGSHDEEGRWGDEMDLVTFVFAGSGRDPAEDYRSLVGRLGDLRRAYDLSGAARSNLTHKGSGYSGCNEGTISATKALGNRCSDCDGSGSESGSDGSGSGSGIALGAVESFSPRGSVAHPPATTELPWWWDPGLMEAGFYYMTWADYRVLIEAYVIQKALSVGVPIESLAAEVQRLRDLQTSRRE
jgi:hypothetical protein